MPNIVDTITSPHEQCTVDGCDERAVVSVSGGYCHECSGAIRLCIAHAHEAKHDLDRALDEVIATLTGA